MTGDLEVQAHLVVRVQMTLDVNLGAWIESEGGGTIREVRSSVQEYVDSLVRGYMAERGLIRAAPAWDQEG